MTTVSVLPFDDIKNLIARMPALGVHVQQQHEKRLHEMPYRDYLGGFAKISHHIVVAQGQHPAYVQKPECAVFIGSHGVEKYHVSTDTTEQVKSYMDLLQKGAMPLNQVCSQYGAGLKVFEVGLHLPTEDITCESAMSEKEAVSTIAYGMEAVASGTDLLILTSMGAGGNFVATMVAAFLLGGDVDLWIHPNDCATDAIYEAQKQAFVKVMHHHTPLQDPLEILRRIGGREISALMGAMIAARYQNIPVILDSLSSLVAALVLKKIQPTSIEHVLVGHLCPHEAFVNVVHALEKRPILDMDCMLDGGIGGVSAIGVVKSALAMYNFSEIGAV